MKDQLKKEITALATEAAYLSCEIEAAVDFINRKKRLVHPAGTFDKVGRFYAAERTEAVENCRGPSRSYKYPEMVAARTAAHCAELHGAEEVTYVRRIAIAYERLIGDTPVEDVKKLLKIGIKSRTTATMGTKSRTTLMMLEAA